MGRPFPHNSADANGAGIEPKPAMVSGGVQAGTSVFMSTVGLPVFPPGFELYNEQRLFRQRLGLSPEDRRE
jgi:hypothetical protein